ncbi:hemin uptake protein HemP [Rhizobium sp. L1K21]|nr:hemin uptake protein HemP [Rhizobium sp. L1K21]MCO6185247.1 hemin uptake protein HemP [Rhizobium sp. L1K21]
MKVEGSVLSSMSLFKGRKEIVIEHNGEFYRLKITRQGKLILNK